MSNCLKWGVIGSGGIARRRTIPEGFAKAANARLVSVYGTNSKTNQEVAAQFEAKACASIDELLASGIDAVYIGSPVQAHLEQVSACAKAGKHVLCEKPLGRSVAEAEEMVSVCERAGVQLGTAFMMRFHSQHQEALKLILAGKIGKPVFARAQLSCWYPPMPGAFRQDPALGGGGSLIDMGNHCIDLLEMFFGTARTVSCFVNSTVHSYSSEDSAVVILKFANGAMGSVDAFFCIQDASSRNALELYGSAGSILATGTIGQGSQGAMIANGGALTPEPVNMYRAEVEAFSEAILSNKPNPMPAALGLRSQKIIAACYDSAKTGRAIAI